MKMRSTPLRLPVELAGMAVAFWLCVASGKDDGTSSAPPTGGYDASYTPSYDSGTKATCSQSSECTGWVPGNLCAARVECVSGSCVHLPGIDCSALVATDGVPCRIGACVASTGQCFLGSAPDGAACQVSGCGNVAGTCFGGACFPAPGTGCDDQDPCTVDVCAGGACQHSPAADGSPCQSDDGCVSDATCTAGVCGGGKPKVCNDNNPCTKDECHPPGGCVFQLIPATPKVSCEDGNTCKGPDYCNGGGICASEWFNNAEGSKCDPHDVCSTASTCQNGQCQPTTSGGVLAALADGTPCPYKVSEYAACFKDMGLCSAGRCTAVPLTDGEDCPFCSCPSCVTPPKTPGHCYKGVCECQ